MKRAERWWFIGIFVLSVIVTLLPSRWLLPVKSLTWRVLAAPSETGVTAARSSRNLLDLIRSIKNLHQENTDLKTQNLRLQADLTHLHELEHENDLLRKELGFAEANRDRFALTPASIVGRSPSTFFQTIVIDKGSADNISVGQAVVSQGFLVGQIRETTATTAIVELITASRSVVPVTLSKSRDTGLLKGGLAGLAGEEFQKNNPIEPGEEVVTSGIGEIIPPGIPVGSVEQILSPETDFVQKIRIHSPVEFGKLEAVLILGQKTVE